MKKLTFLLIIFPFFLIQAQDYLLNQFIVKFVDGTEIQISYEENIVQFGIPSIDALNVEKDVVDAYKAFYNEAENSLSMWYVLKFAEDQQNLTEIISEYQQDHTVDVAEPDYLYDFEDEFIPNDTLFFLERHSNPDIPVDQWALKNDGDIGSLWGSTISALEEADMQATEFWGRFDPENIKPNQKTIAIIDLDIDWQHPDFYEQEGVNLYENSNIWQNISGGPGEHGEDANQNGYTIKWDGNGWSFDDGPNGDINGIDDDGNGKIDDLIGWDFYEDDNNPQNENNQHGTITASAAGARTHNISGMASSAFYCKIMPLNTSIFYQGNWYVNAANAAVAIYYAGENGADIISMSFGGGFYSVILDSIINTLNRHNIILCAAAGNDRLTIKSYPASYDEVISVGGIYPDYTRYGNYNGEIELLAPAEHIIAMDYKNNTHKYARTGGTSLSSPLAAGAIAGLWSQFPVLNNTQMRQRIAATAFNVEPYNSPIYIGKSGSGLVNMDSAYLTPTLLSFKIEDILIENDYDGRLSPGETVDLKISLKNMGIDVTGVDATISSSDPYIIIYEDNADYGDISFQGIGEPSPNFEISVVGFPPMGHTSEIEMNIQTAQGGFQLSFPILIQDNQHTNFPSLSNGVEFVKVCDIDKDGMEDIITFSGEKLYLYRYNQQPIYYQFNSPYILSNFFCAISNIDDEEMDDEILIQFKESDPDPGTSTTKLAILKYNTTQNQLYQKCIKDIGNPSSSIPPLLADLNYDSSDDILISRSGQLVLFRYDFGINNLIEVWNKTLNNNRLPAVADLNQDGKNEIVLSYGNTIDVLDASGNSIISKTIDTGISTLTIADVNNDGLLDIVCFSTNIGSDGKNHNQVWVLNGQDLTEIVHSVSGLFTSKADYENPIVVYNMDDDPELEILFHHEDNILLFQDVYNMSSFIFMRSGLKSTSFPLIGEIQDYNFPLIMHCEAHLLSFPQPENSGRYFMVWKNNGSFAFGNGVNNILETYPNTGTASAAIFDYDGDENYDIVVGTSNKLYNFNGNYELKESKIKWNQDNKNVNNNKLFAQTFNSSFEPADGVNTIVWNYGYETPVILYENVTIPQNVELIIAPGSRIYFQPGAKLKINGTLTAIGTETDSIYFASFNDNPGQRGLGLVFSDPELPSTNQLKLSFCSFKNLSIGAKIDFQWSALTEIRNSLFSSCNTGISLNYANSPLIDNCKIKNNIIGLEINSSSPEIFANAIINNGRYGMVFVNSSADVAGHSNSDYQFISNNGFDAGDPPGGGIYCFNGSAPVFEKTEGEGDYGYNQIINNNHYGVKAEMESPVILGHDYGFNSVYSNIEFQVRAYEGSEVTANKIWWGTREPSSELFDWDASSSIDYSNYLESDPFDGEGKISKNVIKSTNANNKISFAVLSQQKTQNIIKEGLNIPNQTFEGIVNSFRTFYIKKNLIQLKKLTLQNISNAFFTRNKISTVMSYLSNLFIQEKDTSFIPFINQFSRIKNDSLLYRQFSNLKPAHLLMTGKVNAAYQLCNSNLVAFKDTLSQTNNLYNQFRMQLHYKKNLNEAKKIYNRLFTLYPNSDLTLLAEIELASQQGFIPKLNKNSGIKLVIENSEIPKVFALSQNYPNPFNPITTIKYQIPKASKVKLVIFNILGQKVKTLINEQKEAAYYELNWDGRNDWGRQSASGIYFYRLTAKAIDGSKNFLKNKKMLLIR